MKLQQLRFLASVAQNDLNLTAAAAKLNATQPAISKQLKLLEDELGFNLFVRKGRQFTGLTAPGERVIEHALRLLREAENIKGISEDFQDQARGSLSIATTHTQARYVLPPVIQQFRQRFPEVEFHLHQGTSEQIAKLADVDGVDFAIATGSEQLFPKYVLLPCYRWYRRIVVPAGHPLTRIERPSLQQLSSFPIVTYVFSLHGPSSLLEAFEREGLRPDIALTARDADIIKTYVRLGLGVGIVAEVAIDPKADLDLVSISAAHLFPIHTTWIGFPRHGLLRTYMYEFLSLMGKHLTRDLVDRAADCTGPEELDALMATVQLPQRCQ